MYQKIKNNVKKVIPVPILKRTVNSFHFAEALVANVQNGFPARPMKFIGVTGTNGKTSTTYMVATILESAGKVTGMNTTAIIKDGKNTFVNNLDGGLTNAGPFTMQRLLKKMRANGVEWVAMEAASQALVQHRLFGITFEASLITNLTDDHLDYHGTMERYASAKGLLFKKSRTTITNADDTWADFFYAIPASKKLTYGRLSQDFTITTITHSPKFTTVTFSHKEASYTIKLRIKGEFNAYNAVAAIAATHSVGINIKTAVKALESLERIPGRMDSIDAGQKFSVIVDYAHTPDAIEKVLTAARASTKGKVICVTGASGDRALSRRAPVGKIASELSDMLVVTDDEPFTEAPEKIRRELKSGIVERKGLLVEERPDRCEAIKFALGKASPTDTVVIAGMGHQDYRRVKNGKEPWSDIEVATDLLKGKKPKYCKH